MNWQEQKVANEQAIEDHARNRHATDSQPSELQYDLAFMALDIKGRRAKVAAELRDLAEHLERAARNVETGDGFNSLGEVQSRGSSVDRQLGELDLLTRTFHQIRMHAR